MEEQSKYSIPVEVVPAESVDPFILWIYSEPKVGKTTALSLLDNCIIFDLEQGTRFLDAKKVYINSLEDIKGYGNEILKQGRPYKYLAVDTATTLEDMILPLAANIYRDTAMGQKWGLLKNGKPDPKANVLLLPNGAGYLFLRLAFANVKSYLKTLAPHIIMCGHVKDKLIGKEGKEVSSKDIDLTGKIKNIECANTDAIALLYRKDNKCILNFNTSEDIMCGARPPHLRNKEIVLTEMIGDKIVHHWNEIYKH